MTNQSNSTNLPYSLYYCYSFYSFLNSCDKRGQNQACLSYAEQSKNLERSEKSSFLIPHSIMSTINPISLIETMHGKIAKDDDFVFAERYGKIYVISFRKSSVPPTEAQLTNRKLFKLAYFKVAFDLADPVKKAAWQTLADNSGGKYKTARGIAFASYFAQLKSTI